MRVTFDAAHRHASQAVSKAAERLLEQQRQVSSQKRVDRPSRDPSAAAAASVERGRLAATDHYTAAGDSASARLLVADTVLSDILNQLGTAQVAVLGARGSTVTPAQREARALELESLRDSVLRGLNTSFRGTYLFGGAAGTTPPYAKDANGVVSAYQGSGTEVAVDVDQGLEVATAFDGDALARGADVDDVFVVFDRAIAAVRAGDHDAIGAAANDLQRAFDRASLLQMRVGASLNAIDENRLRLGETARAATARISTLEDANMAAAITGLTQAETAYRAALGAAAQLQRLSLMDYLK